MQFFPAMLSDMLVVSNKRPALFSFFVLLVMNNLIVVFIFGTTVLRVLCQYADNSLMVGPWEGVNAIVQ